MAAGTEWLHGVGYGSTHMFLHESLTRPVHADEPARTYRVLTHADCGLMFSVLGLQRYCACKQHLSSPVRANDANGACPWWASVRKHTALIRAVEGSPTSLPGSTPRNRCRSCNEKSETPKMALGKGAEMSDFQM